MAFSALVQQHLCLTGHLASVKENQSRKTRLREQVHNLVKPSKSFNPTQIQNLKKLRSFLKNAEHSVIVGLTATPIVGTHSTDLMLNKEGRSIGSHTSVL